MTLQSDAKFKGKLICGLLHKEFGEFSCEQSKVWKFALMTLKSDAKFEEKLTLGSKNDMRYLVNFNANRGKFENLHFDVLLFSIAYKVSAKNAQKNYLS